MLFGTLFSEIETAIQTEWTKVEPALAGVWKIVEPFVEATAQEIGQIAMQAVAGQALLTISGSEKFGNAVNTVIGTLASQGKSVAATNAAAAVQAAFNYGWSQISAAPAPSIAGH